MPITTQVHRILEGQVTPHDAIRELMERTLKDEEQAARQACQAGPVCLSF